MKRRIAAIAILSVLLLCGVVWAKTTTVVVGRGMSAPACSDHVVEIASTAASTVSIGNTTTGAAQAMLFTPGNDGVIKSIGYYSAYSSGTNTVTIRWKHRSSSSDFDLSSYIDTTTVSVPNGAWVDFDVTDTTVVSSDLYMLGLMQITGTFGDIKASYDGANPYANGFITTNGWNAAGSWNMNDNEDFTARDMRIRYTICY